jgi:DNA-binding MarR family transcriptional regulator
VVLVTPPPAAADEPHWLDAEERAAWLSLTGVLIRLPGALDSQLERDAGLSHFEYIVLAMLSESANRTLRMSQLSIVTNGSMSRLSHVAKRLERQGYIRREPSKDDGRFINAVLTAEGWTKVVATAPGHVTRVRELVFDGLNRDQVRALHELASHILTRIDPDSPFDPDRTRQQ